MSTNSNSTASVKVSEAISNNLININTSEIEIPHDPVVSRNTLLYPVAKAFLEDFPQYRDIISSYERALDSIPDIITKDHTINEFIKITDGLAAHFRLNITNVRICSPDSLESAQYSLREYTPTPTQALNAKTLYAATLIGDITYTYSLINVRKGELETIVNDDGVTVYNERNLTTSTIKNGYVVNIPIPIGCKYCSLHHYDEQTLLKTGESLKNMFGYFIVDGTPRFIIPFYKKPFNKPIVLKNNYEDQLCRTEILYTTGYEYEDSYYTVGAVLQKNSKNKNISTYPDYGFSLQLNDNRMYAENIYGASTTSKRKTLFNFVPIKLLFYAFGCKNDKQMMSYIDPGLTNTKLIYDISNACNKGYKHKEAYEKSGLKTIVLSSRGETGDALLLAEPLNEMTARFAIGQIILKEDIKRETRNYCKDNEQEYRFLIATIVSNILDDRFMPGIGRDNSDLSKEDAKIIRNDGVCVELGYIVRKMYMVSNNLEPSEDKTSLNNRRIRIGQQFSYEYKTFHNIRLREATNEIVKVFENRKSMQGIDEILYNLISSIGKTMSVDQTNSLINSFKGTSKEQSKLRTDVMEPKNQAFMWNRLREIVISQETNKQGSTVSWEHRAVNQSEMFFICPTQTPEAGKQTGRYRTLSVYSFVTLSSDDSIVKDFIRKQPEFIKDFRKAGVSDEDAEDDTGKKGSVKKSVKSTPFTIDFSKYFIIRINGYVYGYSLEMNPVDTLYEKLMQARCSEEIPVDTTIILDRTQGRLDIWTDTSRLMAPFVNIKYAFNRSIAEDGTVEISPKSEFLEYLHACASENFRFTDGLQNRFVEYLDPEMCIHNAVIAPSMQDFYKNPSLYTHVAFPNSLHGIIAGVVPAINMNTGVRASYLTNHVKQAIGPVIRYPQLTCLTEHNVMIAPQTPIVRTSTYDFLKLNQTPYGHNVIVAFMQYKYNQEDAIIINKQSVEQGLLKIDSVSTKSHKIEKNEEIFELPPSIVRYSGNLDSYSKLDENTSLPKKIGEFFYENDAVIGKTTRTMYNVSDSSVLNDKPDGINLLSSTPRPLRAVVKNKFQGDNKVLKQVTFGQYRAPIRGDKFNSEHCQKGTCGSIIDPAELPYATNGMRPDIIFNPPSIFKRKTYGQIYLPILAKIGALLGCPIDCTPYHSIRTEEEIFELLHKLGLDDAGYETMYDPDTGKPYRARIFFANHYWERQNHLVEQKINVRNGGPRDLITGIPTKGRKAHGGQSCDRMTMDAQLSSGVCETIRDVHLNQGACINMCICNKCRSPFGYLHKELNNYMCPQCGTHSDFTIKRVPPASMMMMHIMNGLHCSIDYYD